MGRGAQVSVSQTIRYFQSWRLANSDFGYMSECMRVMLHARCASCVSIIHNPHTITRDAPISGPRPKHHAAAHLTIFAIFTKKYLEIEEIFV